jgi:hypothetical protein
VSLFVQRLKTETKSRSATGRSTKRPSKRFIRVKIKQTISGPCKICVCGLNYYYKIYKNYNLKKIYIFLVDLKVTHQVQFGLTQISNNFERVLSKLSVFHGSIMSHY